MAESGPLWRRLERAVPSADHGHEALPEEAGTSDDDCLPWAAQNGDAVPFLRFVHRNSSNHYGLALRRICGYAEGRRLSIFYCDR
jgi:hypothetical protein